MDKLELEPDEDGLRGAAVCERCARSARRDLVDMSEWIVMVDAAEDIDGYFCPLCQGSVADADARQRSEALLADAEGTR